MVFMFRLETKYLPSTICCAYQLPLYHLSLFGVIKSHLKPNIVSFSCFTFKPFGSKNMAVEGGTVSHYYILVIRKFIDFMSLFRHSVWFSFSVKQFSFAELEYATYSSV